MNDVAPTKPGSERKSHFTPVQVVAITLGLILLCAIVYFARYLLLAALIGIGFGAIMAPLISMMKKKFKLPRALTALLLVVLLLGGIAALLYGMGLLLAEQVEMLAERGPAMIDSIQSKSEGLLASYPALREFMNEFNFGEAAKTTLTSLLQGLKMSVSAVAGFFVVLTISVYTAVQSREYLKGFITLFPAHLRPKATEVTIESGRVLRKWFRSQLIVMSISGGATTLGLWILGIDYWLILGTLTGILGFIPYVGSFITVVITALVTLGSEPDKIWWVLAIYFGVQQLEGDVTTPLVMKGGVQLPEVHTIVAMLVMGSLFGLLGVFVAPPLLAVLRSVYAATYEKAMDRKQRARPNEEMSPIHQA